MPGRAVINHNWQKCEWLWRIADVPEPTLVGSNGGVELDPVASVHLDLTCKRTRSHQRRGGANMQNHVEETSMLCKVGGERGGGTLVGDPRHTEHDLPLLQHDAPQGEQPPAGVA